MSLVLYISLAFVGGWIAHVLFRYFERRVRIQLQRRYGVAVKPGESAREQYQRHKDNLLNLKPMKPPVGSSPEVAERFRKLSPLHQHQAVAALKRLKADG